MGVKSSGGVVCTMWTGRSTEYECTVLSLHLSQVTIWCVLRHHGDVGMIIYRPDSS